MFERRLVFVAAASLTLLSFTDTTYAAPAAATYAAPACRCSLLPKPGLQPDYQFYYDTPGYFPGFLPAAGMARHLEPPVGSGFSEGPFGVR